MIITGISDEAGKTIEAQIKVHKSLGWDHLELRLVNGKNVAGELSDKEFDDVVCALEENEMYAASFGSAIANWSRPIDGDFSKDVSDLKVSAKRMQRLNVKTIRIMSWVGEGIEEGFWRDEAIRRSKELSKIAEDNGIILLHENCTGWGGKSAANMLEIKSEVDSPAYKLLYDIGNVISYGQDPVEFFNTIRGNFDYIHAKDANPNPEGGKSSDFTYCGQGAAMLEEILTTVIREDGYDGTISIEPHLASIIHNVTSASGTEEEKAEFYYKYGQLLNDMVGRIKS